MNLLTRDPHDDLHDKGTDRLLAAVKACDHVSSREYRAALEKQKPALAQWNRTARERMLKHHA